MSPSPSLPSLRTDFFLSPRSDSDPRNPASRLEPSREATEVAVEPPTAEFAPYFDPAAHIGGGEDDAAAAQALGNRSASPRDAVDPQPINEIIPSALGIHIIDTQHKIVMSIATHTAILDMILAWLKGSNSERKVSIGIITELLFYTKEMILAWLKGSNSERKVSIGIITELLFYTKELGVEEQELIVKSMDRSGNDG